MDDARAARAAARQWLAANQARWPELRAAHFVGGITTMPDTDPFPRAKDIDLHLILDEASPLLAAHGPFLAIVEEQAGDWPLEAGLKSIADYRSPEAVLANPEIAHHLTVDSILFDPDGLLAALEGPVRAGYRQRQWVEARLTHERRGFAGALGMRPMAAGQYGMRGELNIMGYLVTYVGAALGVAALGSPRVGGRTLVHLRSALAEQDSLELYEELLEATGIAGATPEQARAWLATGATLFDRAVVVRRTPHPFQHKLHAHQRAYFVESCAAMIAEGYHREATGWSIPFHLSSMDVLLADGTDEDKVTAAVWEQEFLAESLGFTGAEVMDERFARALRLYDAMFDLADQIAASNPSITD